MHTQYPTRVTALELNAASVEVSHCFRPDAPPKATKLLRRALCPTIHHSMDRDNQRPFYPWPGDRRNRCCPEKVPPLHSPSEHFQSSAALSCVYMAAGL